MLRHPQLKRALAVSLGVVVCLCSSCTSTRPQQVLPPEPPVVADTGNHVLSLSAEQERRAAALAQFAAGVSAELRDGLEAALPFYEEALRLDPKNTGLAVRLAQVAMSRKDFTGAKQRLEAAAKDNPSSADPWLWLGIAHRGLENPAEALNAFEQALKINPRHVQSLAALIELLLQQDALDEVVAQLDKTWRQESNDGQFWLSLGKLYTQVARQKPSLAERLGESRAREAFAKAVEFSPRDAEALLNLADAQVQANNFVAAAEAYSRLLAIRPDLPRLREQLAMTFLRADLKEKAAKIFREMIKRDPTKYETYNSLAGLQEEMDQDEDAIANYQQSLVLNPDQVEVHLRLAVLHISLQRYDKALQNLNLARQKFPTTFQIPYLTGIVHSEEKNFAKAITAFAEAEALMRDDEDEMRPSSAFYFSYGAACERTGAIEKAEKYFQKSLELDPNNHAAANYLGYMWADRGVRLDEAHDLIKRAVAGQPNSGAYLDSLGWVLYKLGRVQEALPYLARAVELVKDDAVVHDHMAEVLLKLGKRDEAIKHLKQAVAIDPQNKELTAKLRKLVDQPAEP